MTARQANLSLHETNRKRRETNLTREILGVLVCAFAIKYFRA
ncbi:hypothetical protein ALT717_80124 [Alteromonas macleodii]